MRRRMSKGGSLSKIAECYPAELQQRRCMFQQYLVLLVRMYEVSAQLKAHNKYYSEAVSCLQKHSIHFDCKHLFSMRKVFVIVSVKQYTLYSTEFVSGHAFAHVHNARAQQHVHIQIV